MNKKLLVILWAYVSWIVTALLYNKKTPSEIKLELEEANKSWEGSFRFLLNNFIEIHKNLLDDIKFKVLKEEKKELFYTKKNDFLNLVKEYKLKAQEIFEEYKSLWEDYIDEQIKKLEKFYNEKKDELDKLRDKTSYEFEEAYQKLLWYYNEFKEKIKK